MNQEVRDILKQWRKLFILEYAKAIGNATKAWYSMIDMQPSPYFYFMFQKLGGARHH